jgi:hypothetical protein
MNLLNDRSLSFSLGVLIVYFNSQQSLERTLRHGDLRRFR